MYFEGRGSDGIWHVYLQIIPYENVPVEKRESISSHQEELATVQDHLNLAKQVRLMCTTVS